MSFGHRGMIMNEPIWIERHMGRFTFRENPVLVARIRLLRKQTEGTFWRRAA